MYKNFWLAGGIFGLTAVVLGAFTAHILKSQLGPAAIQSFEIGVRYQFYHAFTLIITGLLYKVNPHKWYKIAGWLFFGGVLLFSGSLYLLALRPVLGITHWSWLGPLTPIGGVLLIFAWVCLIIGFIKNE